MRKQVKNSLLFFSLLFCLSFFAQQQNNVWHFGSGAGIDFNSGTAAAISGGQTTGQEAVSTIADVNGNLLFYTDGATAWTRNHTVMPNGSGLAGGSSATQTLIVPIPGNCSQYYIFHVQDHMSAAGNLSYSKVDMCLNNGFGDVVTTSKNIYLNSPCGEKITAVKHQNDTDIWVISHKLNSNQFIAYLVTASGIQGPVTTSIGGTHASNHMIGPMKSSHDGNKICLANTFGNLCELYDFNKATGVLSNQVNLVSTYSLPGGIYGIEFSPNDSLLYISTTWTFNRLYQLDLYSTTTLLLSTGPGSSYTYGALQMGPDGIIYMAMNTQNTLGAITSPNTAGMGSNFVLNGLTLAPGTTCLMGLPNAIPSSYKETIVSDFSSLGNDTTLSTCTSVTLSPPSTCNATYNWSDGSTSSSISVSSSGTYWVTVSNICGTLSDTINVTLPGAAISIQSSANQICTGDSVTLTASGGGNYSWSNGSSANSITVSPSATTTYSLGGSNACGSDTVLFTVNVSAYPSVAITGNDSICSGQSVMLTASGAASYAWNNGSVSDTIFISPAASDTLVVSGTNFCGSDTAVHFITVGFAPVISVNGNNVICLGDSSVLSVTGASNYLWSTGAVSDTIVVYPTADSAYSVSAGNFCGTDSDTITVNVITVAVVTISGDTSICNGDSTTLSANGTTGYAWSTGAVSNSITVSPAASTTYTVAGSSSCGNDTAVFTVNVSPLPVITISGTDTICAGDTVVLNASGATNYSWNTGDSIASISITPQTSSVYSVTGNTNNCFSSASINVTVNPIPLITVTGTDTICAGDSVSLSATGAGAFNWNTGETDSSIVVSPATTFTYLVSGSINGCSDTTAYTVTVNPIPVVSISGTDTICAGQSVTLTAAGASNFSWSNSSTASSITVSPTASQSYSVTGTTTSCTDTALFTVIVNPVPVVSINGSDSICLGQPVTLLASGADSYVWNNGSAGSSITVSPSTATTYSVIGTADGCADTELFFVDVVLPPVVSISGDDSICQGETVSLYASGAASYSWGTGSTQNMISVSPGASTTYTVVGTGACGADTSAFMITVNTLPDVSFTASVVCNEVNVNAQPASGAAYFFDLGDNTQQIGISASHLYADTGIYSITLIVSLNGCTDTLTQQVSVLHLPSLQTVIPNTFTPNGDGKNDIYTVTGSCKKLSAIIFNRWGQKIFETEDLEIRGWDGKVKGEDSPEGAYFILIKEEEKSIYSGSIQIFR